MARGDDLAGHVDRHHDVEVVEVAEGVLRCVVEDARRGVWEVVEVPCGVEEDLHHGKVDADAPLPKAVDEGNRLHKVGVMDHLEMEDVVDVVMVAWAMLDSPHAV